MAVFRLELADGRDIEVEAEAAGRAPSGEIVLEGSDGRGRIERIATYRPDAVKSVSRRGPAEGGVYTWLPQPASGQWWCY
ncbi:hypothetical protein [Streptomyces sp. NPDC002851]